MSFFIPQVLGWFPLMECWSLAWYNTSNLVLVNYTTNVSHQYKEHYENIKNYHKRLGSYLKF